MAPLQMVTANPYRATNPPDLFPRLAAAGFEYARIDAPPKETIVRWQLDPRGEYDWRKLDEAVAKVTRAGMKPFLTLGYDLDGGKKGILTKAARETFARWAGNVAKRYEAYGLIMAIWNEPDHPGFWLVPDPVLWTQLVLACVKEVRAKAPRVPVWAGDFAYPDDLRFARAALEAGLVGKDGVNVVTFHPYRSDGTAGGGVADVFPALKALCDGFRPKDLQPLAYAATECGVDEYWIAPKPLPTGEGGTILPPLGDMQKDPWRVWGGEFGGLVRDPFGLLNGVQVNPKERKTEDASVFYHRLFDRPTPRGFYEIGAWLRMKNDITRRFMGGVDSAMSAGFDVSGEWRHVLFTAEATGDRLRLGSWGGPRGDMEPWQIAYPTVRPIAAVTAADAPERRRQIQAAQRVDFAESCARFGLLAAGWYADLDEPDPKNPAQHRFGLFDEKGRDKVTPATLSLIGQAARASTLTE